MSGPEVSGFLQVLAGQTREKLSEKINTEVNKHRLNSSPEELPYLKRQLIRRQLIKVSFKAKKGMLAEARSYYVFILISFSYRRKRRRTKIFCVITC